MNFLFYNKKIRCCQDTSPLDKDYTYILWQPAFAKVYPTGSSLFPFVIWWLFHFLHVFSNKNYAVLLVMHKYKVIHRTLITPKYFRFPFMGNNDLQLGDIWTDPIFRGKGIATSAINYIFSHFSSRDITFWYVVNERNLASVNLAEKVGFSFCGKGKRYSRYGISIIGRYMFSNDLDLNKGR
ncbi:MAG: hypothetical protein COA36_07870 [Desulfotalea sp.]|nr:MAG: hypothetical protein COA36_07870 [Desulfotalea sp.]